MRNVRLLLAGLAASQAGDWLYNLALLALVFGRTHSTVWVGLTTAARILPEVALGPLAGILADRVDRRRLMIGSDVIRAATMATLALLAIAHAPIMLAPVLAALCAGAGSVYAPCVVAILPRLAADEYGLNVLTENIQDNPNNYTRFWVVGPKMSERPRAPEGSRWACSRND